ncbi:MAG: YggS family pyridoxal phosphate-dependent enzyme [Eubacteriales bacterium]|nr:YggS family pyridoxal phosphate-dependent enzyme [Eubacteriales bacterium]
MSSIEENLTQVRERLHAAAASAGRSPGDITLVAVSKYVEAQRVAQAAAMGQLDFGENHAQEFRDKQPQFPQCRWHFIGQLQTNKVKYLVGKACLIQSVDRETVLRQIERTAAGLGVIQDILIEVNIAQEPAKGGVAPGELDALLDMTAQTPHVRLRGLMSVPPAGQEPDRWFANTRELWEKAARQGFSMEILSMGMSHDFETAVGYGATMVRVGSSIFGGRPRP